MDVATFRENYGKAVKKVEDLDQKEFNVFKILGLTNYEIRHSNFLKWLFNKKEFRKEFLNKFKDELKKVDDLDAKIDADSDVKVEREKHFEEIDKNGNTVYRWRDGKKVYYKVNDDYYTLENTPENMLEDMPKKYTGKVFKHEISLESLQKNKKFDKEKFRTIGRYIDINIIGIGDNFTLTIENKIDSDEHDFQCVAYRNYMLHNKECNEKYEDKKHYFVFLAKSKPHDFDEGRDEENGRYPGYVFMDYKMIVEILELENVKKEFESPQSNKAEKEIVQQYISTIEEWEHLPDEYRDICSKIDIQPFAETSKYKKLRELKDLTESEKRFVEVARQYYLEIKEEFNEIIDPVIRNMSIDKHYIKDDYGRGGYALAIPLSLNVMSNNGKYKYLYLKDKITEDEYNLLITNQKKLSSKQQKEQEVLKGKAAGMINIINNEKKSPNKKERAFQTVDYRASVGKYKNPSIAIIAGMTKNYSMNLCDELLKKDFVKGIEDIDKGTQWNLDFFYYYTDGSKQTGEGHIYHYNAVLPKSENYPNNPEELYNKAYIKDFYADAFFDYEYLKYLKSLKDNGVLDPSKLTIDLMEYYLHDKKGIENTLKCIEGFLKYKNFKNEFEDFLNEKKHPIFNEQKAIGLRGLIGDLIGKEIDDDCFERIKNAVYIALFNSWINNEKAHYYTKIKEVFDQLEQIKTKDDIDNLDEDLKTMISNILGADDEPSSKKSSKENSEENIKNVLNKKMNQVNGKCVRFGWQLDLIYQLSDNEYEDVKKEANTGENCSHTLTEIFYNKTLEGVNPFGYDGWFKEQVFKSKEELGLK